MSTKLFLFFFSLFPLCFSCNCPTGSSGKSRFEVICDSYANNNDIYTVRVTAAYCKCQLPSSTNRFSCIQFMLNQTLPPPVGFTQRNLIPPSNTISSVDGAYECQDFENSELKSYYRNCSSVITDAGITNTLDSAELLNEATTAPVTNLSTCQNVSLIDERGGGCAITVQPCYYTVSVESVYKGNRYLGDTFNTSGPDLLSTCRGPNRVLTVGETYVLGVGGPCYTIDNWDGVNDFSTLEFDILFSLSSTGRSTECPGSVGLTGTQVAIVTVVVIIYVAIIAVLLIVAAILSLKCEDKRKKHQREAVSADDESKDALQNVTDDNNSNDEKETVLLSSKSTDI